MCTFCTYPKANKSTFIKNFGPPRAFRTLTEGGGGGGGPISGIGRDTCHLQVILAPPPPPPNTTYHLRGGPEYHLSPKNHFPPIFQNRPFFVCLTPHLAKRILGKRKMKFKKPKEVFVHNGLKNKNLSHFLQRCHQLGESKLSFSLIFSDFWFFLLQSRFCGSCFGEVEAKFEKLKEVFCPEHAHIQ
jgi:hypothetical protein